MTTHRAALAAVSTVSLIMGVGVLSMPLLILGAAGAATLAPDGGVLCAGGGTGQTVVGVAVDAEQVGSAATIIGVTAGRRLPVYAAVVAVATSVTEASLRNSAAQSDHDSEGLFQQRISIYTAAVADDPVRATDAFLDRLVGVPDWQNQPVGVDAQAVQVSAFAQRYQPNAALAERLVAEFWPTATNGTAAAVVEPVCAGGGGAGGPAGSNVAGTTAVPPGFVITGSAVGQTAIRFALAQLGKPYVYGAAGPDAFDCSGLTMAAWAAAGIALPHWTVAQAAAGTPEPTDLSEATGGDLVLIPGSDGTPQAPGHVGMIAGYVDTPTGRVFYLVQAPETSVPVELTPINDWSGQVVAVRHIA